MTGKRLSKTLIACTLAAMSAHGQEPAPTQEVQETEPSKTQRPHPLGGFVLIHDGKYDPHTMRLFERLGVDDVTYISQGDDPEAEETGRINIESLILQLSKKNPDGVQGWLEIDFESPFVPILRDGDADPRFEETLEHMRTFVERTQDAFPEADVTIYNVPSLPFWVPQPDGSYLAWGQQSSEQRAATLQRLEQVKPLLDQMDWFLPRFYDVRPSSLLPEKDREKIVASEIDYRKAHVEWLREYIDQSDRPDRKIIPVVKTRLVAGSTEFADYVGTQVPIEEFLTEQVVPAIEAGSDGVFIWGGGDNYIMHMAFTPPKHWSDEQLEKTYREFRHLGALGPDEEPRWRSANQKREFLAALGRAEAPYVAAAVRVMRKSTPPSKKRKKQVDELTQEEESKSASPPQ